MKIKVGNILDQMSPAVRKAAEEEARERGLTLEAFVERQISVQLNEDEITLNVAMRGVDWDIRAGGPPPTVEAGLRGRIGR